MSSRKGRKRTQQLQRARRAAAQRRRRTITASIVVAAVLVVAAGITGAIVLTQQRVQSSEQYALPKGATRDKPGVPVSQGPVNVDVYFDFMCPRCKEFETMASKPLNSFTSAKQIQLTYHPLNFLNRFSNGTDYSTRSAAAAGCAADAGKLPGFITRLYARQPKENSRGLTNKQIIAIGRKSGITAASFAHCVTSQKYQAWVTHVSNRATANGVHQTPTVFVDGKKIDASISALTTAINGAQ